VLSAPFISTIPILWEQRLPRSRRAPQGPGRGAGLGEGSAPLTRAEGAPSARPPGLDFQPQEAQAAPPNLMRGAGRLVSADYHQDGTSVGFSRSSPAPTAMMRCFARYIDLRVD
jgi:hypothetical protein